MRDGYINENLNESNRYELILDDGIVVELHCGDCFELEINSHYIPVRIEYNNDGWYLIADDAIISMPTRRKKIRY